MSSLTELRYYRGALAVPFVGHAAAMLLGGSWGITMGLALFVAGIPYLLWAGVMALWMRGRPLRAVRAALWTAPLTFLGVCSLAVVLFMLVTEKPGLRLGSMWGGLLFFAPWVLGFGYLWVLAIFLGWKLYSRFHPPFISP